MERPRLCLLDNFPLDLAERVLSCLTTNDLTQLRLVNRQWKQLTDRYVTRLHTLSFEPLHQGTLPRLYPNLKAIDLSSVDVADDVELKRVAERLAEISMLQAVTMRCGPGVTKDGIAVMGEILSQISHFRLAPMRDEHTFLGEGPLHTEFDTFKAFPQVTHLDLSWNSITFPVMHSIAFLPHLEVLNLKNCLGVDDKAIECLTTILTLHTLNLSGTSITDDGLMLINDLELEVLNLSKCEGITDDGIFWLQHIHPLKKVDLSCCPAISSAGVEQLTNLPNLTNLYMQDMKPFRCSFFKKMTQLVTLSMRDCSWVKDETLEDLAQCQTLRCINLRNCYQISDNGLKVLCRLPFLQSINLRGCTRITDTGLNCLSTLPCLEDIDLSFLCQITDAGLMFLTRQTKLRRLVLNWCSWLAAAGLQSLQAGCCHELKELSIKGCHNVHITDLVSMSNFCRLEKLDYEHCLCSVLKGGQKKELPVMHRVDSVGWFEEIC